MSEAEQVFFVNPYHDPVVVRINGRASYLNAGPLRDFFDRMIRRGRRRFMVDFRNCTTMDSTFLGILAGAMLEVQEQDPAGEIWLCGLGPRNLELVRNLGLHRIGKIAERPPQVETDEKLQRDHQNDDARSQMILDAHLNLIECDESNRSRFQDVITFLRNQPGEDS